MGRMNKTRMNKNRMNRFRKKMKKRGGALGVELANHKDVQERFKKSENFIMSKLEETEYENMEKFIEGLGISIQKTGRNARALVPVLRRMDVPEKWKDFKKKLDNTKYDAIVEEIILKTSKAAAKEKVKKQDEEELKRKQMEEEEELKRIQKEEEKERKRIQQEEEAERKEEELKRKQKESAKKQEKAYLEQVYKESEKLEEERIKKRQKEELGKLSRVASALHDESRMLTQLADYRIERVPDEVLEEILKETIDERNRLFEIAKKNQKENTVKNAQKNTPEHYNNLILTHKKVIAGLKHLNYEEVKKEKKRRILEKKRRILKNLKEVVPALPDGIIESVYDESEGNRDIAIDKLLRISEKKEKEEKKIRILKELKTQFSGLANTTIIEREYDKYQDNHETLLAELHRISEEKEEEMKELISDYPSIDESRILAIYDSYLNPDGTHNMDKARAELAAQATQTSFRMINGSIVTTLEEFLNEAKLSEYYGIINASNITLDNIQGVTDEDLEKLGLKYGHKKRFLRQAKGLVDTSTGTAAAGTGESSLEHMVTSPDPMDTSTDTSEDVLDIDLESQKSKEVGKVFELLSSVGIKDPLRSELAKEYPTVRDFKKFGPSKLRKLLRDNNYTESEISYIVPNFSQKMVKLLSSGGSKRRRPKRRKTQKRTNKRKTTKKKKKTRKKKKKRSTKRR